MLWPGLTWPRDIEQMTVLGLVLPERVAERTGLSKLRRSNAVLYTRRWRRLLAVGRAGRERRGLSLAHHLGLRAGGRCVWA